MKPFFRSLLLLSCLCVLSLPMHADPTPLPLPAIPATLTVPAGQTLALTLTARGVQIYACRPVAADPTKFEWAFQAPAADLFDVQGHKVGHHYAGPTWELTDGGKVVGKWKAKADAPDGKGIPWLLLDVAQASDSGIMSKVVSIQRVATVGGNTPSDPALPAKAGQEIRVDYTATYLFYVTKP